MEELNLSPADVSVLTAQIVSAYVSNNSVQGDQLPVLINNVRGALLNGHARPAEEVQEPAVPIKKSIGHDYIICLENGKKFKSLKRHLRTSFNMSPEQYRAKWGLPANYPMVAPAYATARSNLAKNMGLGRRGAARRESAN